MFRFINYVTVGCVLLALYMIQEFADIRWHALEVWQSDESFKRNTGFIFAGYFLLQWSLTLVKVVPAFGSYTVTFTIIHKWLGAFSPLIFYVHAMHFGYAYLFFLSVLFFANMILAMLNTEQIKLKANWYFQAWMIAHVSISVLLTTLMVYHGFIAYYYK